MPLLHGQRINSGYGKLHILFDIDFSVKRDEILVIVGPNGSGKSTLLKTVFGLTTLYDGRILFDGEDITRLKPHERAKRGLAYLPQVSNTFETLTVRENLMMAAYTLDEDEAEAKVREVLDFLPRVREKLDQRVYNLSGGERQMVAMAMAIMREPKLIMLDEPTAALAPKIASEVLKKIVELKEVLGMSVVLVEQNAKRALEIGDRALLLVAGQKVFEGGADELLNSPDLASMYLGIS